MPEGSKILLRGAPTVKNGLTASNPAKAAQR